MTDLGRGYGPQGSEPWHPGDPGYGGQQPVPGQQDGQWQQQPQQQPQQMQQQQYGGGQQGYPQQQGQQFPQAQQGYPQQQGYPGGFPQDQQPQQPQQYGGQQYQQGQQQYGAGQQGYPQQGGQGFPGQQGYPDQQQGYQQQSQQQGGGQGFPGQQQAYPGQQQNGQGFQGQQQSQQGFPGQQQNLQGFPGQQQPQAQPGMPQQGVPQPGMQQPGVQQQGVPQPGMSPAGPAQPGGPQAAQAQPGGRAARRQQQAAAPAGPGADGIDWEAEAAALEAGGPAQAEPEQAEDDWDGRQDDYADGGEDGQDGFLGEEDDSREGKKKRKEKGKKSGRRNGGACLLVALVLMGAVSGAGWWGYGFYQDHFGPPPDFQGEGTSSVQIEIKKGSTGGQMGMTLKAAGVVKSVEAYTQACDKEPKCTNIQYGFYTLKKEMSASAALQALVEQAGGAALVLPEGLTAAATYVKIDDKLKLPKGTAESTAKAQIANLGLPAYANGNLEGFLWPTRYNIADGMKPEDLLKQMVKNATDRYASLDGEASKAGLKNGYEVVIEASILQAEGNNRADFAKMARTIQNRLVDDTEVHRTLGMDTTLQYSLGRKELTQKDMDDASNKFNTNRNPGLPPTPISNPGDDAIKAVLNPADGKWLYFIAMSPETTLFSNTYKEHLANVEAYCTAAGQKIDKARGHCTTK
ncbi:endolytic transglycosylase MltG [Kitasatospora sp. NBC_01560]|uniref:endolytic transglycosylase MltG n=1 Tax=Kitasatospora sp. NBC_01560 TaxID=2975965 RepID=UPI0038642B43